jgi:raffinose/stachyose/melibiose transport system permease protein
MSPSARGRIAGVAAILVSLVIFVGPLAFVVLMAAKSAGDAASLRFSWPHQFRLVQNAKEVIQTQDYVLITAYLNSTILTVVSVTGITLLGAAVAFVLQRRRDRLSTFVNGLILAGLIVPPAVVPTIWTLQKLHLFGSMSGLILVEIAYGLPFSVLLFRAFMSTIPRELDEAAFIDGAGPLAVFFRVIVPLIRPVMATVIILETVAIFNDFQNPLYFLPGTGNATVQLTVFNFSGIYLSNFNLLFMDILLITIPPFLAFVFFSRKIVAGVTSGAVKG